MVERLILASGSPRRAQLLTDAGIPFEVRAPDVDERPPKKATPPEAAMEIATRKARAAAAPGEWVLAGDTLVVHAGRLLGKPSDETEAHAMLSLLAGDTHEVVTGVALVAPDGGLRTAAATTRVSFRALGDDEIDAYIRTGEPLDKAGAYGIQGKAKAFVASIDGPLDNVIGLPLDLVRGLLRDAGFPVA